MTEAKPNSEFEFVLNEGINVIPLPSMLRPFNGPIMLDGSSWVREPYTQEDLITRLESFFGEVSKQGGKVLSIIDVEVAKGEYDGPGIDRVRTKLALIQKG